MERKKWEKGDLVHVPRDSAFKNHIPVTLVISYAISQKMHWGNAQVYDCTQKVAAAEAPLKA